MGNQPNKTDVWRKERPTLDEVNAHAVDGVCHYFVYGGDLNRPVIAVASVGARLRPTPHADVCLTFMIRNFSEPVWASELDAHAYLGNLQWLRIDTPITPTDVKE
jgi:hypothetical protein